MDNARPDHATAVSRHLLNAHGLRCTAQRVCIFDALRSTTSHPTAEELFRMVKPGADRLSLATVYNALEAFCEAGLVRKLATLDGTSRYDADTSEHMHVRMRGSGAIRDVPRHLGDELLAHVPDEVIEQIESALGVEIEGVNIQLFGRSR